MNWYVLTVPAQDLMYFVKKHNITLMILLMSDSVHWSINPPPPLFLAKPPLNLQTVQAPHPHLGIPPLYINFS